MIKDIAGMLLDGQLVRHEITDFVVLKYQTIVMKICHFDYVVLAGFFSYLVMV